MLPSRATFDENFVRYRNISPRDRLFSRESERDEPNLLFCAVASLVCFIRPLAANSAEAHDPRIPGAAAKETFSDAGNYGRETDRWHGWRTQE